MIAGIPDTVALDAAWTDYSEAVQASADMERSHAPTSLRVAQTLHAHRLHRRFTLMSDLAEVGAVLERASMASRRAEYRTIDAR